MECGREDRRWYECREYQTENKKQNVKLRKDKTQVNCIKLLTTVKSSLATVKKSETGVKTLFYLLCISIQPKNNF